MTIYSYQDFLQTASAALSDANNANAHSAVVVVNLEGLPELDGILGYTEVDAILGQLVQQVRTALNATDIIGPSGRYQICCLLADLLTDNHALLAAHKILRVFAAPLQFNKRRITLLPRIGIALNSDKTSSLQQLMSNASSALHQAKRDKTPIRLFDEKEKNLLLSGIDIWSELDRAIETGELQLAYQPQLWIATGKIRSAEALLRWNHPTRGNIPPD
ncbi:MAG TPA: diguanylate cyclase, partial [Nitrosomonas sp.]|nr:diguanylate cyclase [Nitrosomonas sp.]